MKPRATKTKTGVPGGSPPPAFTRIDLLCVVLAVALIGLVQFSALAQSASRSHDAVCFENLRRLSQGWLLYAEDNSSRIVPNADGTSAGKTGDRPSWVGGWLDFTTHLDNIETRFLTDPTYLFGGKLGPYVQRDSRVFRCPADRSQVVLFKRLYQRTRSVSMNGWMNGRGWSPSTNFVIFKKTTEFTRLPPAQLWVLMDEREDSINDGHFHVDMASAPGAEVMVDYPASYHAGGANLGFADGHAEYWAWRDPRTNPELVVGAELDLNEPSPGNPDVVRLQAASTFAK